MAKLTIIFGALLAGLGLWSFFETGSAHPTALIPLWFGLALILSGALAHTENPKRRMLWMHIAVTAGLLGFLGAAIMALIEVHKADGGPLAHPAAVHAQVAMAGICVVFVALCVKSFIEARRGRNADIEVVG